MGFIYYARLQYSNYVKDPGSHHFGKFLNGGEMSGTYILIFTLYAVLLAKQYVALSEKGRKDNLRKIPSAED